MKKILFVFGTRPEAIKMAPVINVFKKDTANYVTLVAVTGQHREMLDQVLSLFNIVPDYDLNLMAPNQTLESLTSKSLTGISDLLVTINPDLVFVQGDTSTTFSASLAAFYRKIPVAHIEAGLRTKNIYSPFPEEINRRMTTSIASFHFPPTVHSQNNLLKEGIEREKIKITGNTVIDSLLAICDQLDNTSETYNQSFSENYGITFGKEKTILVTGHRRESFGAGFENICKAIKRIAIKNSVQVIYPVHLNPNVQEPVNRILGGLKNVYLIEPQDYVPFILLMKKAYVILTDSGGVQEEAPSLGKPVLIMRENTERQEGVDAGTARLVGKETDKIINEVELLLHNTEEYFKMANAVSPYGTGEASKIIYDFILNYL